MVYYNLLLWI